MDYEKKRAIIVYSVVGVIVIAAIGIWWHTGGRFGQSANSITDLSVTQTPPGMTQDMVVDKNAVVVRSYTTETAKGQPQSTLIYSSQMPSIALYEAYSRYLLKSGWSDLQLSPPSGLILTSRGIQVPGRIEASNTEQSTTISIAILQDVVSSTRIVIINVWGASGNK